MIQKRALRSIYPGMHYNDILMLLKLPRLKERHDGLCKTYFDRLKSNIHKLHHLLPERRDVSYTLINQNAYPVPLTRTERFRKSLIPRVFTQLAVSYIPKTTVISYCNQFILYAKHILLV